MASINPSRSSSRDRRSDSNLIGRPSAYESLTDILSGGRYNGKIELP